MKLIKMNEIQTQQVNWLWYPYIPYGKITLVQGDPCDGKTTFVLAVAALLTAGKPMPESNNNAQPMTVIYQTAEDGLADTIKPRLEEFSSITFNHTKHITSPTKARKQWAAAQATAN